MRVRIISIFLCLFLSSGLIAQDIHFTQFTASPLTVNPAFTGNFHGLVRVNTIYRNQWGSIVNPFETVGFSIDAPIVNDLSSDDYLAAGLELYNDKSGGGNLTNFSALGSIAYHKQLGKAGNSVLSVGLQGGYTSKNLDIFQIYFADEFRNNGFDPGSGGHFFNNNVNYFTINLGGALSTKLGKKSGMQFGLGANNLNSPQESFSYAKSSEIGLPMRFTGQLGFIFPVGALDIKPAFLAQYQAEAMELIGGAEFNFRLGGDRDIRSVATSIFLGAYYRYEDAIMATAGVQTNGFRIGAGYDINTSGLKSSTNGFGAWELALTYIKPDPMDFAKRIVFPCQRF